MPGTSDIARIVTEVLQLNGAQASMERATPLLGAIPEFDSMAVVAIMTALEDQLGIFIEDDEVSAEIFETLGALEDFVATKVG